MDTYKLSTLNWARAAFAFGRKSSFCHESYSR